MEQFGFLWVNALSDSTFNRPRRRRSRGRSRRATYTSRASAPAPASELSCDELRALNVPDSPTEPPPRSLAVPPPAESSLEQEPGISTISNSCHPP